MRQLLFTIILFASACFAAESASTENTSGNSANSGKSDWRFQIGLSAGEPTPLAITAGIGYQSALFRIQGMGWKNGTDDFWCNARGGIAWTFFRELPFNFDLGIGGGYAFAEAPNGYHKALNKANGVTYIHPYNYEETLDISAEIFVHLYGIFTQISVPMHYFMGNKEPTILWRAGYMLEI